MLAQEFHDIAPPVDYSLIPAVAHLRGEFPRPVDYRRTGLVVYRPQAQTSDTAALPRERALAALGAAANEIDSINPYQFSIRVSDILRRYVTDQYGLPVTRQTSVEFLERMNRAEHFSEDEKRLLGRFS